MGRRAWAAEPSWGEWGVPDTELGLLADVSGKATLEVGCGTGYVSAWLARAGASPIGLDNSSRQLATAAELQGEFDLSFPLIHGAAEHLPFPDESFDLVVSEYGAAIWSDPYEWIPEAVRVLRPGGELIFLGNSVLFMLCAPDLDGEPAEPTMLRPQFGMRRFEWPDDVSVEFHISHGAMIRLLRANGLEILDLIEVQAPEGRSEVRFNVPRDWARQWPSEEIWRASKRA
ncbi:MAG: class I SAM-dependent methyltransferase [Acidimicrobiia bacterium]